ncbi:Leukotoxin secretion protein D [Planktothrix tepida]|uniref:Secretion protein HlyD family protein n=2 Tax=Planktothrix TaxID=54304 RepID=A0A1J1LSM8_9CYAN|nr:MULTISPECIES: HlyD family efflux transporter periplasmic adaptor subunit [Planktothrix]CAD5945468.1 Leukotoxin secretion protein D [Planktothrix pseudagardhii]CAD5965311.1 Leukotoxin secretion protein D [Planktothrix tepida]CUR35002.1 Secretion protein HlyD family protein [Planktothrix tepida PCC 9214]
MFGTSSSEFLRPVRSDEFLPPISLWTTLGGLGIVGTVILAFILAAVTRYKITIKAPATVRPSGELSIVQVAKEGTIQSIKVKQNQVIHQGDAIAYIDDSKLQTQKKQFQDNIQQNQEQIAQINAQITALNSQTAFEQQQANRTVSLTESELNYTQRDYQNLQATTLSEVNEAEANFKQSQEEWQKAQADLKSAEANLMSIQAALNVAKNRQERYQPLAETGAISQDKLEEAQLEVARQEQALEAQHAVIEAEKQVIQSQYQGIAAAKARWDGAKAKLNPSHATVKMAEEKVAQQRAMGQANLEQFNQEKERLIQQKIGIQNQINQDTLQLQQLETQLKDTVVSAPVTGTIYQLNLRNSGQVVRPGDIIAQIVPNKASLVLKASVPSQERDHLKIGQDAYIRIEGCPYPDFGVLPGKIQSISPDVSPINSTTDNASLINSIQTNNSVYEVIIQPEDFKLNNGEQQCLIRPGMTARTDIIANEDTILRFFLKKARLIVDSI